MEWEVSANVIRSNNAFWCISSPVMQHDEKEPSSQLTVEARSPRIESTTARSSSLRWDQRSASSFSERTKHLFLNPNQITGCWDDTLGRKRAESERERLSSAVWGFYRLHPFSCGLVDLSGVKKMNLLRLFLWSHSPLCFVSPSSRPLLFPSIQFPPSLP